MKIPFTNGDSLNFVGPIVSITSDSADEGKSEYPSDENFLDKKEDSSQTMWHFKMLEKHPIFIFLLINGDYVNFQLVF